MKKSYLSALLIMVLAVLWVASGAVAPRKGPAAEPAVGDKPEKPMQVRVRDSAATLMTAEIDVTGRTEATRRVDLKAETAGQVTAIVIEKGAAVKQGDVIARLDERDRRARLAEARERLKLRTIEHNAATKLKEKGFNSEVRFAQSRADLEAARAELRRAEIDLANTEIRAPFDGVIAEQMIETGNFVDTGTVTFTIVDLDPIELSGYVTEKQVEAITPQAAVKARLLNGMEVEGRLIYVAPAADPQTRTFRIEASVPNPESRIAEGMTATLRIPMRQVMAHKISPAILTLDDKGRVGVKVLDDENRVVFSPVTIVADEATHMWIMGLPDAVRLITVGQDYAAPGAVVTPVTAEGDGAL